MAIISRYCGSSQTTPSLAFKGIAFIDLQISILSLMVVLKHVIFLGTLTSKYGDDLCFPWTWVGLSDLLLADRMGKKWCHVTCRLTHGRWSSLPGSLPLCLSLRVRILAALMRPCWRVTRRDLPETSEDQLVSPQLRPSCSLTAALEETLRTA